MRLTEKEIMEAKNATYFKSHGWGTWTPDGKEEL